MDILIKNCTIVTMDETCPIMENGWIAIDGGKIAAMGTGEPTTAAACIMDAWGKVLMPGLVNTHTHVSMSLLRGYADDYNLHDWLHNYVFPAEGRLDARCVKVGALLSFAEMLRTGTVSVSDMYFKLPAIAEAAFEAGLYANLSNGATCFDPKGYDFAADNVTREMEEMLAVWHGADGGRIRLDAAIHAEYTSFEQVWRANAAFANAHKLHMQVHLSETQAEHETCLAKYGKTPAAVLAEAGVFDRPAIAAHCVWISSDDMAILAQKRVSVAHNPISNLKLASGVAPVAQMMAQGLNVALGTDGVCSNNSHDLFEEIKMAPLLQKGTNLDPTLLPAWQALKMATVNGAAAQGRNGEMGMLRTGMDASLIALDLEAPHLMPIHNIISTLAYSARGSDVCLTMVRGKILYEKGHWHTIDMDAIKNELSRYVMNRIKGT